MKRIQIVKNCYQCQYCSEATDTTANFCHETCRVIEDLAVIPEWCPLDIYDEEESYGRAGA